MVGRAAVTADSTCSSGGGPYPLARLLSWAVCLDLLAVLPVGLAGALAVLVSRDTGASPALGGVLVSAYFLAGASCAVFTGPVVDRMGWHRAAALGLVILAVSLAVPAVNGDTATLVASAMLSGVGAALVQPATSALISHTVTPRRRSLAINIKMAAAPGALVVAGLSIPLVAQFVGWRATFLAAAAGPCLALALMWTVREAKAAGGRSTASPAAGNSSRQELWLVGVGVFLGAMVPGTLVAFMVPALVNVGFSDAVAGVVLGVLGVLTVASRVVVGLCAHRPMLGSFRAVAVLMLLSGVGVALMLFRQPAALLIGGMVAFSTGYAWLGQAFALAVRMFPDSPAAASAIIQSGGMGGSAVGPFVGASVATTFGLTAAWIFAALTSVCGAVLLFLRAPRQA